MFTKVRASAFIFGALVFGALAAQSVSASDSVQTFVDFAGEIVDQNAVAVTGVLPLEFRVYTSANAKKAVATEKHFVSVVDGKYTVSLGEMSPIQSTSTELYVAVLLDNKELVRQKVTGERQIVPSKVQSATTQSQYVQLDLTEDANFSLTCPKGYVVTGIEGKRVDGQLNSFRLICSNTF